MLFRKKYKKKDEKNKEFQDFILPLYLNQRFVYDILAIKNNGFTEFFEIKDKSENNDNVKSSVNAGFGNNNEFSLIQANMSGGIEAYSNTSQNNEKSYKKNLEINIQKVPSICRILKKYGLTGKINTKILSELVSGHMNDTCKIALGIYSILSETLSIDISKKTLQQAAELHDVGKVFIPKKIICKAGKLNKKEKIVIKK